MERFTSVVVGRLRRDATACLGDNSANVTDDAREEFPTIPTVSEWGLVILTLSLLVGIKLKFARHSSPEPK